MREFHQVLMPNGKNLASREAWMMMHPGFNAGYKPGDLIELQEGIFILNDDLVPMQLATDEQIQEALRAARNSEETA